MASTGAHEPPGPSWIEIHSIKIVFNADIKVSEDLDVFVKDPKRGWGTSRLQKSPQELETSYTWKLKDQCNAYPGDAISITSFHSRLSAPRVRRKKIDEFKFAADAVIEYCNKNRGSSQDLIYTSVGKNSKLFLNITMKGASSIVSLEDSAFDDIDKLGDRIAGLAATSLSDDTMSTFRSVFSSLASDSCIQFLDTIMENLKAWVAIHPLVHIVFKAILIPYELLKGQHEFIEDMKVLADDMCTSLKSMANAFPFLEMAYAKDCVVKLLRVIVQASKYVNDFLNKGGAVRLTASQFRGKLNDFRTSLRDRRLDFREAVIIQTLVDSRLWREQGDDISFLQSKLDPPKQSRLDGGCLDGTRKTILSDVDAWLKDSEERNVLWITGAPGAGKSAVASTIVRRLLEDESNSHDCVKFFVKRSDTGLSDPSSIWRSIAYGLVEMSRTDAWYRSVKVDILDVMSKKSGRAYPEDALIEDQYRKLICEPLNAQFSTAFAPSRRIVLVIDALDECNTDDQDQWDTFLDTIVRWSKDMPRSCKLIVTSRAEADIERKLKGTAHRIALDTGDRVSDESRRDIELFFKTKLEAKFEDLSMWREAIGALTLYAAGLFVWAATVVDFVTQKGGDRTLRLKKVLENMAKVGNKDPIGTLYAQILLASASELELEELNGVSLVLASLVLLREELPRKVLLALFSPDTHSSTSIETAIDSLNSIIVSEGSDKILRVCHKSLSDFLMDEPRVHASITSLVGSDALENNTKHSILAAFSLSWQHALVAERCLLLMNSSLGLDIPTCEEILQAAIMYACSHWINHLQGVSVQKDDCALSDALVPLIQTFVKENILRWMGVISHTESINGAFLHFREAIDQLAASPFSEHTLSGVQTVISSIADNIDIGALDTVQNVLSLFTEFRSFTNIVIRALLSPFEQLKHQHGFIASAKSLETHTHPCLKRMGSMLNELKQTDVEDLGVEDLDVIVGASKHALDFVRTGVSFGVVNEAPSLLYELDESQRILEDRFLIFREAVVVEKLVRNRMMDGKQDVIPFLQHILNPVEQRPIDGECLDGTRKTILSTVDTWLKSRDASNVFWISGAPGAGKTALASSIVRKLYDSEQYGSYRCAKFFIKRRDMILRDPRTIWRTIAFELAELDRGFKVNLLEYLSEEKVFVDCDSIENQYRQFISEPLRRRFFADPIPSRILVIVIDALDECLSENPDELPILFDTVLEWNRELPQACKLIVTSRFETEIVDKLKEIHHQLPLDTGDVVSKESSDDIRHFLETEFSTMKVNESDWPGPTLVERMTEYAAGLFVWAMTVIEYVRGNPYPRIKVVLDSMDDEPESYNGRIERLYSHIDSMINDKIGRLYGQILLRDPSRTHTDRRRHAHQFRILSLVLASVSLLRSPLPFEALKALLPPDSSSPDPSREFSGMIYDLNSIIVMDGDEKILRVRHRSFSDFLQDKARVQGAMVYIASDGTTASDSGTITSAFSLARQSALLAEGCLLLMNKDLKFGETSVSASLIYACHHWANHVADVRRHDEFAHDYINDIQLAPLVKILVEKHTLQWIEILRHTMSHPVSQSTTRTGSMESIFRAVAGYMKDFDSELSSLMQEASNFLDKLRRAIFDGQPILFARVSAHSLAPNLSLDSVSATFGPFGSQSKNILSLLPLPDSGRQNHWNPHVYAECIRDDEMSIVYPAFSVSPSINWHSVLKVPFFVACGRMGIICQLFNVGGGDGVLPFTYRNKEQQDGKVERILASSKDGLRLAFLYKNGKVGVWDFAKGANYYRPIKAHEILTVAFVADKLALGSSNGKVTMYNLTTQDNINRFDHRKRTREHSEAILSLASSPDGLHFVSGSLDNTMVIWDTETGKRVRRLRGHEGAVCTIAWSADGNYIASGSNDYSVRIWTPEGQILKTMVGHSDAVLSVAFRHNSFVVSGSRDGTIQFWDIGSDSATASEQIVRNTAVKAIAFSTDFNTLAAVYEDSHICLWDVPALFGKENPGAPFIPKA